MEPQGLIGKTIASAAYMKSEKFDDEGWLKLEFSDGTMCVIVAGYGGYTGHSEDEYPTLIGIADNDRGLIPANNCDHPANFGTN